MGGQSRRVNRVGGRWRQGRAGTSSLDYVLVLGVTLPLAAFILKITSQIMNLAYELICGFIAWPFL